MENLVVPLLLSGTGVSVAAVAFANRDKPDWQRAMPVLIVMAVGQVVLGAFAALVSLR